MASLLIRHLDDRAKRQLRIRAAIHGRSMEAEACGILHATLIDGQATTETLGDLATELFGAQHGAQNDTGLESFIPARDAMAEPPDFL